jgi:hypothetical protein
MEILPDLLISNKGSVTFTLSRAADEFARVIRSVFAQVPHFGLATI